MIRATQSLNRSRYVLLPLFALTFPLYRAWLQGPATVVPQPRDGAWMGLHESFLVQAKKGGIELLFLGDSITQGWNENHTWQRFYGPRKAANFGIGGDRTQHVLWRIDHGELEGITPKVVVVLIGTNNLASDSALDVARGVTAIVEAVRQRSAGGEDPAPRHFSPRREARPGSRQDCQRQRPDRQAR